MDGVTDVFSLCILGILCNVLDRRTYQCGPDYEPSGFLQQFHFNEDVNNVSPEERRKCARTRGLAYDLIDWFFHTHTIIDDDTEEHLDSLTLFTPHIARVAAAIIFYVELYEFEDLDSCINLRSEIRLQVTQCFQNKDDIDLELKELLADPSSNYHTLKDMTYSGPRNLTITKRNIPAYESTFITMLFSWEVTPLLTI